uniref:Uncharacterized protein n=1 Tax=Wuchereria bancrofti TaxID=6293 RepID=A0A1I8EJ25_WUCBA
MIHNNESPSRRVSEGTIRNGQYLCAYPHNCVNFMDQEKLKRQMQRDPINGLQTEGHGQMERRRW